jgi:hypothetical protein
MMPTRVGGKPRKKPLKPGTVVQDIPVIERENF